MSRKNDLAVRSAVIEKSTIRTDLFGLLAFDADENGDNGDRYLRLEAIENGYFNNLSYYIDQGLEKYHDVDDVIEFVLRQYDQSAWECEFDVINIDGNTSYCSIAILS